jgi:DNA repair protein RecO
MSYKIYHTEGFILSGRPYGEANKVFRILTPDLGLVNCLAQGIRLEKSKLRFGTSVRRFVKISLVRGREYWRLIHVELDNNFNNLVADCAPDGLEMFLAKTATLLSRLIYGESRDPDLYEILKGAVTAWVKNSNDGKELQQSLEILTVVRLLTVLGYRSDDKGIGLFAEAGDWQRNTLADFKTHLPRAVRSINDVLQNSHL